MSDDASHYAVVSLLLSLPFISKHSPQHPVIKHPQSTFFL